MEYGIIHSFKFENGVLIKTPLGYITGLSNIILYNNNNNIDTKIEQYQFTMPHNLEEILI